MIRERSVKYYIKYSALFFALLVSFWIPMYKFVLSYFIVAWILFSILNAFISEKQNIKSENKRTLFLIIQLSFFGLIILSYFYSANKDKALTEIVHKLSLFLFPLLFYFSTDLYKKYKNLFLKVFIVSVIVVSFLSLFTALYNSIEIIGNEIFFNASVHGKYDFIESITHGGNYFFYTHFSFFHHPAYFSMYIVFSIAILFYLKDRKVWFNSFKQNVFYYIIVLFLLTVVFLLSSRAGILSAGLLIAFRIIVISYRNKNKILIIFYIIVFLFSVFYASKNERVKSAISDVKYLVSDNTLQKKPPPRFGLWRTAIDLSKKNYLLGVGIGDIDAVFSEEYEKNDFAELDKIGYNAHNQFLETFMTLGILGILLLLLIFIVTFIRALKKKQLLFIIFLGLTSFNFLFESMLNTIAGIVFFSYFLNYFIFLHYNEEKNDSYSISIQD